MSCPTCDHTMQAIGTNASHTVFWCPRCGTIQDQNPHSNDPVRPPSEPSLPGRCRAFRKDYLFAHQWGAWQGLGIAESINTPENRK